MAIACGPALVAQSSLQYPPSRKGDVVDTYFGTKVADPYRWMEDLNAAEVKQWVDAENAVTAKYLDALPLRDVLKKRITELWNYRRSRRPGTRAATGSTTVTAVCSASRSFSPARRSTAR